MEQTTKRHSGNLFKIRWMLVLYDFLIYAVVIVFSLVLYRYHELYTEDGLQWLQVLWHFLLGVSICLLSRFFFRVYGQIWRYGGVQSYIRLMLADAVSLFVFFFIQRFVPGIGALGFVSVTLITFANTLVCLAFRMLYRLTYKRLNRNTKFGRLVVWIINVFGRANWSVTENDPVNKIRIALVGAGRVGTGLAEELLNNPNSSYQPMCFVDIDIEKLGREIFGIVVIPDDENTPYILKDYDVQEVVFALPSSTSSDDRKALYKRYKDAGFKIKVYDYPTMQTTGKGRRTIRDFDIEELLFRKELEVINESTINYYTNKVVLITGGGGSIGSELARQIAKMEPKQLIILDVYENGAYDLQQELKMLYGDSLNLAIEILSICNKNALERVFKQYRPNIVIMAAAHKHVPLMEHNIIEAVENNVFGTLNTVLLAEKYEADRVHLVSTDKAVNPTNVMGATKRICEMIVFSHAKVKQHTTFSATRFGNVLGSAGSVIPLFKKQIANGGPVTLTDKRIIRYFMTIPEASQLVLHSATIAKNGELMVLDMGQPIKIYDLAVTIIRLSGLEPDRDIEIRETGLRPGEKLYEELLIKNEKLTKTNNKQIFIEKDKPISLEELEAIINNLSKARDTGDEQLMKQAIKQAVPTYTNGDKVKGKEEK